MKNKIEEFRHKYDLTQADIARAAEVNPASVSRWEQQETQPKAKYLMRLARRYKVELSELADLDDDDLLAFRDRIHEFQQKPIFPQPDYIVSDGKKTFVIEQTESTYEKILKALSNLSDRELETVWGVVSRLQRG